MSPEEVRALVLRDVEAMLSTVLRDEVRCRPAQVNHVLRKVRSLSTWAPGEYAASDVKEAR